jgi:DNA-binding transcriptional regulator YdaS (Cro superfamily)
MNEDQVYQRLLEAIKQAGGQRPFAQQIGVTPSYINDIVHKRRLLSDRILAVIGIERVVTTEYRERSVM